MSNTNGYNSLTKSMNGIITVSDGMGGTMEDGVVTCNELECPRINVDKIESKTAGANVSLYTELVGGSIHLANGATTLFIDAPTTVVTTNVTNLNATNISTNNIVSAAPTTAVNLFNNQTTGTINLGTGRTTGNVIMGSNTATGSFNIRNAGVTNIGAFSSSLTLGTSQTALQTVSIGNLGVTNMNGSAVNVSAILNTNDIRFLTYGTNSNLFTTDNGATIQMGNAANQLVVYSPTTINYLNAPTLNSHSIRTDEMQFLGYGLNTNLFLVDNGATIQMGNAANQLVIYSPTNIAGGLKTQTIISPNPTITSSLFTNNNTGNIDIGTGLTTGILTIGGTGAVNINGSSVGITTLNATTLKTNTITASNSSSNAVIYNNITTGTVQLANNAVLVEIGTSASTISLGYNSIVDVGKLTITNSEIRTIDSVSTLTIGGPNMATTQMVKVGTSQENVYLGAVTATAKVFVGDFKFTADTVNLMVGSIPNVAGTMTIANALTTGSLQLATGLTTGSATIGNNAMTGNINIRTTGSLLMGNTASSIELGTGASVTNNINLGNNLTTINALGSTINIGTTTTTGPINIGTSITNGNILIGNHGTVGATGNLILRSKNNIDMGSGATSVSVGIGAPTIDIGTSIIGGTANINIGTTAFTNLNLNSPINPNYDSKYAVTATTGGAPAGCIGSYIYATTPAGALALASPAVRTCATFTNLPVGVWLLYWILDVTCPTTASGITNIGMIMATTVLGNDILSDPVESANFTLAVGRTKTYQRTQIYTQTNAATDIYFTMTATFTGTLTQNATTFMNCKALRIA